MTKDKRVGDLLARLHDELVLSAEYTPIETIGDFVKRSKAFPEASKTLFTTGQNQHGS